MREKILTVLVVASLILSVFNLVSMLRTNGTNTITDIVGQSSTAELYLSNMTRTTAVGEYQHFMGFYYSGTLTNPTNETIPCVISMTFDNGTRSQSFVLSQRVYQSVSWIFVISPQSNYTLFNPDFDVSIAFKTNYTTVETTIFSLLNGAVRQQTFTIQQEPNTVQVRYDTYFPP